MAVGPKGLAERLGVHVDTVYRWTRQGMPHYRVGNGRMTFSEREVSEWMRRNSTNEPRKQ